MDELKFVVLDGDDLEVVSTHLQDAVVKVSDILWRPQDVRDLDHCILEVGGNNLKIVPVEDDEFKLIHSHLAPVAP